MFQRIVSFLFCGLLTAADSTVVRSGPFELYSLAGEREAKDAVNFAEQLRYTLGWQLGNADLQTTWPVRILLVRKKQAISPECRFARDAYVCSIDDPGPLFASSLTKVLLDSWVGHLPPPLERGLIQVYSTIEISGTRVTLGAVPPQKDRDWARAHMIAVDPGYSGKLRVMLGNLGKGVEPEVAYRNAFGQGPEELERSVDKYLEAGQYGTLNAPSRPINAQRQLIAKDALPEDVRVLQADLLFAAGLPAAEAAYKTLVAGNPQLASAHEGLGLIALRAQNREAAQSELALCAGARGLVEYSKLLTAPEDKRTVLTKAAAANPRWAEPHLLLAAMETHPAQKLAALRKATQLEPGRAAVWIELALLQDQNKQYAESAKSWAAAERATGDPEAREQVRQSRLQGDQKRMDAEQEAKNEARRRTEAEEAALRNKALMGIREAEARANAGRAVVENPEKLDVYREGADTKKAGGSLQRVNCMGTQATLFVTKGKSGTTVLVRDPGKVAISGGGQTSLTCGPQKPVRNVTVEYTPRSDLGAGIAGEAVSIEFR